MSPQNTLTEQDIKTWGKNLLLFTAPTLAIFFGQLAIGVDYRAALAVAVLGLYGAFADIFTKYKSGEQPVLPTPVTPTVVQTDVQQTTTTTDAK